MSITDEDIEACLVKLDKYLIAIGRPVTLPIDSILCVKDMVYIIRKTLEERPSNAVQANSNNNSGMSYLP